LHKYLDEIIQIAHIYEAKNAYVILGGDLLHGLIHLNARLESKENLVQQIMSVSDYIINFLYELSKVFNKVDVYSTAGNHSRVLPHKEDNSHGENFDVIVPYICKKALSNIKNLEVHDNYMDYDIATFNVRGHTIYATHGDKDTPQNVVYHMTQFARKTKMPLPDLCYLGHRHCNGLSTVDGVKVIESGCIDGMDSFAVDKRLVGTPEQTVTVISEDKLIKTLCDIQLD
jgi:predicted phosphodiesterase